MSDRSSSSAAKPQENHDLIGHESAERMMIEAHASGRLPHAWLLSGPKGIGKATLAYRFARFLFAGADGGLFGPPEVVRRLSPREIETGEHSRIVRRGRHLVGLDAHCRQFSQVSALLGVKKRSDVFDGARRRCKSAFEFSGNLFGFLQ